MSPEITPSRQPGIDDGNLRLGVAEIAGVPALGRNAVGAVAILLCILVLGAFIIREKCRLGDVHWPVCGWMGIPHAGGPFPTPQI
jgi:hypothetical protein